MSIVAFSLIVAMAIWIAAAFTKTATVNLDALAKACCAGAALAYLVL